jgi:SAM-dependent methyltransferase
MQDLIVPDCCLEQIRKQRTQFARVPDPAAAWAASIARDWAEIAGLVPWPCAATLDIGCGLAGIDVPLYRQTRATMFLCDRDIFEKRPVYGYSATPSAYCRYRETTAFLSANGIPDHAARLSEDLPDGAQIDMVLSLISWGFHYPVSVYLRRVARILRPGGVLVLDLRAERAAEDTAQIAEAIGPAVWTRHDNGSKETRVAFQRRADA